MNINDDSVLDLINNFIATERLTKNQILQLVNLVPISNNIKELKDNMRWEAVKSKN